MQDNLQRLPEAGPATGVSWLCENGGSAKVKHELVELAVVEMQP